MKPPRTSPFKPGLAALLICFLLTFTPPKANAWGKKKNKGWGEVTRSIEHDGVEREYILHVPENLLGSKKKVPLVIMLHGGGGNGANAVMMSKFAQKANEEGFIAVFPSGSGRFKNKLKTWNFWHCCGYAMKNQTDDSGFLSALIDTLVKNYPVDPRRVLVTGMSNGAMMSHRAGIELSKKVAVIAPVVGTMFGDEPKAKGPVAALIINGLKDTHIKPEGGVNETRFKDAWDGTPMQPILWQSQYWAKINGCKKEPQKIEYKPTVILYDYDCPEGLDVRHLILENGTHSWPGGRAGHGGGATPTTEISATDEIWAFFEEMTR